MIEKFCDIDSQIETHIKLKYQLFDETNSQIYYSNKLEELMKIYKEIPTPKTIYEVIDRYDNVIKLKIVVSQDID